MSLVPISLMDFIILAIIAFSGCCAVIQIVNSAAADSFYAKKYFWLADAVVVVMYLILCYITAIIYASANFDNFILFGFSVVVTMIILLLFVRFCFRHRNSMSKINSILFLVYFMILLYGTIFMRIGTINTSVETRLLAPVKHAFEMKDFSLMNHMLLNVAIFIPFGYLIPSLNKKHFGKIAYSFFGGLVVSTIIEGLQMIKNLGECDINDIIANTLGACVGYILVRIIWRISVNWKI